MITPNDKFPEIELPTVNGQSWSITKNEPENFSMLVFYRGYHCPVCKKYNKQLEEKLEEFQKKGVEVVAISCDSEERAEKTKSEWGLDKLTLAYDLSIASARSLGLYISHGISDKEPEQFSEPGLFLLKPDGTVYAAYYQSMPFARPPLEDMIKGIDFILDKDYPARGKATKMEGVH